MKIEGLDVRCENDQRIFDSILPILPILPACAYARRQVHPLFHAFWDDRKQGHRQTLDIASDQPMKRVEF